MVKLSDFSYLSFDVYGTLIDWESGILTSLKALRERASVGLSDNQVLQAHARWESLHQRISPQKKYNEILSVVYKRLAEEWGVHVSWDDCLSYGGTVKDWPEFPDSKAALSYLKQHYKLIVLSNVDNESFSFSNEKLGVHFDHVVTAEDVLSYKPSDGNFSYMMGLIEGCGQNRESLLHVAESMFHDHVPASRLDMARCHIYRRYDKKGFGATMKPEFLPTLDFQFNSMADLVDAHKKEISDIL